MSVLAAELETSVPPMQAVPDYGKFNYGQKDAEESSLPLIEPMATSNPLASGMKLPCSTCHRATCQTRLCCQWERKCISLMGSAQRRGSRWHTMSVLNHLIADATTRPGQRAHLLLLRRARLCSKEWHRNRRRHTGRGLMIDKRQLAKTPI